jgi:hypothetical protein
LKCDFSIIYLFFFRYTGPLLEEGLLEKALDGGPKSVEYTGLVEWLSKELKILCKLDEHVNALSSAEDSSSFLIELRSFLKQLGKCTKKIVLCSIVSSEYRFQFHSLIAVTDLAAMLYGLRINSIIK